MTRLHLPAKEDLTPEQRAACDEVTSGKRGKVPPPMIAWLRNPELARRTQKLGELLRYETTLPPNLLELAVIVCARHWTAHVQWTAHKRYAIEAGIDPSIVAAIAAQSTPDFTDDREQVVYEVSIALLSKSKVPTPLYERAVKLLGEQGAVELVVLLGYYCISAFTLNMFEMDLPESLAPELQESDIETIQKLAPTK